MALPIEGPRLIAGLYRLRLKISDAEEISLNNLTAGEGSEIRSAAGAATAGCRRVKGSAADLPQGDTRPGPAGGIF